jgi:ParB family transcriptional regulator, chromosome partitioning protein
MANKTLRNISINKIATNPHNPRLIFDIEDLDDLKHSIAKVGILVPITVYINSKKFPKERFILLDGERRWRSCIQLDRKTIPANVIDEPKDITQNILYMFNIHTFRKDWALFPTALKLEILMDKLNSRSEKLLSESTGLNRSTIRRCKKLLWFPNKYREILLDKTAAISTDFFIELHPIIHRLSFEDRFRNLLELEKVIDKLIDIFSSKQKFRDVKDFREFRKSLAYFSEKDQLDDYINRLEKFLTEPEIGIEIFKVADIEEARTRDLMLTYIAKLNSYIISINPDKVSDYSFKEQLLSLANNVNELLLKID